jgi:hypothetical protein
LLVPTQCGAPKICQSVKLTYTPKAIAPSTVIENGIRNGRMNT